MRRKLLVGFALVATCLILCLSIVLPTLGGTTCQKCNKVFTGTDGEQSQLAKAMGLELCMDCWLDSLYGSGRSDPLPKLALLGEDGKVLPEMLPEVFGGNSTWGSITGTLSAQTDLQGALDSRETPAGAQTKVDTHNSTYPHADIVHANRSTLDAIQESFTTLLKNAYDDAVIDAHTHGNIATLDATQEAFTTALKTAYDNHINSAHAPSNAQANADITKAEIEAKLIGEISSHTHAGGGGESETVVVLTADRANTTTTLANATDLSFVAQANSTYIIEGFIVWDSSVTTTGIKLTATASGSPTITTGHFITDAANGTPDSSSYNANDVVVTTSASMFTTGNMGKLDAVLKTGASTSTWQLRFAAETTGTITIKAGSTLRYRKVQ